MDAVVGVRLVPVRLALGQVQHAVGVVDTEGEAVAGAHARRHGYTSSRRASDVTRASRISSKPTVAA